MPTSHYHPRIRRLPRELRDPLATVADLLVTSLESRSVGMAVSTALQNPGCDRHRRMAAAASTEAGITAVLAGDLAVGAAIVSWAHVRSGTGSPSVEHVRLRDGKLVRKWRRSRAPAFKAERAQEDVTTRG